MELFGGEPIQHKNKEIILEFLDFARKIKCGVSIISNGYELLDFALDLAQYRDVIGVICVTLDGTKAYHDKLRITAQKEGSFDRIVSAVDLFLKLGINIRIATNIYKDNIDSLDELFEFYKNKGWTEKTLFTAYIGRVFSRTTNYVPDNILYEGEILEKIIHLFPHETPQWLQLSFLKSAEFLSTQLGLSYNQNEYGKAKYHYCWATSPILLGYYVDSELRTYRCPTTVSNKKYDIGNINGVSCDSYLSYPFFSRNIFSEKKCLGCSLGRFVEADVSWKMNIEVRQHVYMKSVRLMILLIEFLSLILKNYMIGSFANETID